MDMSERIPFCLPDITEQEIEAVVETLRSGWLTTGPRVKRFEEAFAAYTGAPHAVALNSCTAALHMALSALDLRAGDEVITTPYTFVASAETVVYHGARPVFVDVDPHTLCLDPARIEAAITPRTRAIVPVDLAGHPAPLDEIMAIARAHGLKVVEDAAHATETWHKDRKVGAIADATAFSFYATKNLSTGEGGMLTCLDGELAARARVIALHGMSKDAWKRYDKGGSWFYEIVETGYKYNLTDLAAALGLVQLARIEAMRARRLRLNREALAIDRARFIEEMAAREVAASVHFIPVHLHPWYRHTVGYQGGEFPVAEAEYAREISLPFFSAMSDSQAARVAEVCLDIARSHRR
jgi:dTDP-4-amino-4,6-dideoxygalactose transaminase